MNDLISRQAVIETTVKKNSVWNTITNASGDNLEQIINSVPAADVVEVVRCKDCKHRKKNTFCLHNMRYEDDNGLCSYGERKNHEKIHR